MIVVVGVPCFSQRSRRMKEMKMKDNRRRFNVLLQLKIFYKIWIEKMKPQEALCTIDFSI